MRSFVVAALIHAALVSAATHTVLVGKDGALTFEPPSLVAPKGDIVQFRFVSKNHSLTQSTFAKPCERMTTPTPGIHSGYFPVTAGATEVAQYSITLEDDSAPAWFFCEQGQHCKAGMVFALNPTASQSFAAFQANAKGAAAPGNGPSSSGSPLSGSGGSSTTSPAVAPSGTGAAVKLGGSGGTLLALGLASLAGLVL